MCCVANSTIKCNAFEGLIENELGHAFSGGAATANKLEGECDFYGYQAAMNFKSATGKRSRALGL
jgi:hypothetical protein